MSKYCVSLTHELRWYAQVEANSKQEAIKTAKERSDEWKQGGEWLNVHNGSYVEGSKWWDAWED